jgi:hypothetical protein
VNKNIAKKWVKALRSGKYKQGRGLLKQFDKHGEARHCCLGVLCELYNQDMKKQKKKTLCVEDDLFTSPLTNKLVKSSAFDDECELLPTSVKNWAELRSNDGAVFSGDKFLCLSEANDNGKRFTTIANIIEQNVENL